MCPPPMHVGQAYDGHDVPLAKTNYLNPPARHLAHANHAVRIDCSKTVYYYVHMSY